MIALALLLAQVAPEPGAFTHGPWQGRCYRAGALAGMDHESCRATMPGPVQIDFERDAASMVFRVAAEGCEPLTLNVASPPASLAPEKRGGALSVILRLTLDDSLKRCKRKVPKLDAATLGGLLTETDGLASRN